MMGLRVGKSTRSSLPRPVFNSLRLTARNSNSNLEGNPSSLFKFEIRKFDKASPKFFTKVFHQSSERPGGRFRAAHFSLNTSECVLTPNTKRYLSAGEFKCFSYRQRYFKARAFQPDRVAFREVGRARSTLRGEWSALERLSNDSPNVSAASSKPCIGGNVEAARLHRFERDCTENLQPHPLSTRVGRGEYSTTWFPNYLYSHKLTDRSRGPVRALGT